MADETLVREPLLEGKIASGRRLIELLDADNFDVVAALWLYTSSADEWRLVLATPMVDSEGPRSVYLKIRTILGMLGDQIPWLNLSNISVVSPEEPLIKELRKAIRTERGIYSIRFTRNRINDFFIEDALIYRAA